MKSSVLIAVLFFSTSVFAGEGGARKIRGTAASEMVFTILESLKAEGNSAVIESEDGDAVVLQLASEEGTITCTQSEGVKNGKPTESVVKCDVSVD